MDFPFSDDTDCNPNNLKFYSHVSFRSVRSSSRARHSLQITTTWTTSICRSFNMMRWNILSVRLMKNNQYPPHTHAPPTPSIRKGNVALMLWYGEKSDLALGSGMFLLRLWWVGPGRRHMKGALCQAAKDVQSKSNEDQNTWTDLRTCMPHIIQAAELRRCWQA